MKGLLLKCHRAIERPDKVLEMPANNYEGKGWLCAGKWRDGSKQCGASAEISAGAFSPHSCLHCCCRPWTASAWKRTQRLSFLYLSTSSKSSSTIIRVSLKYINICGFIKKEEKRTNQSIFEIQHIYSCLMFTTKSGFPADRSNPSVTAGNFAAACLMSTFKDFMKNSYWRLFS